MILYELHQITDSSVAWRDEAKYVETWLLMVHKKGLVHVSVRHAYIEKSLAHTRTYTQIPQEKKKNYTTGIRNNKKKSQRINVSVVAQSITNEVKLQVQ